MDNVTLIEERQNNFDLLRILSTFAVVLIHINAVISSRYHLNFLAGFNIPTLINTVTRFCVPCFVMISGAFILNNKENANFKKFYKKSFYKLGVPLIIFTVAELTILSIYLIITHGNLLEPLTRLVTGNVNPYWFMFMLTGLYFLAPFIIRIKEMISNKCYCTGSIIWMIFSCISQGTSTYKVSYSFGVVFSFLGFFLIGNVVYENLRNIKKMYAILSIVVSFFVFIFTYLVRVFTGFWLYTVDPYINWFSPFVVIASILLFIGFANIKISINLSKLSSTTFLIYLFHTRVYLVLLGIIEYIIPNTNEPMVLIIILTLLTFIISLILSTIYLHLWNYFEKKYLWKEKWKNK